MMLAFQLFMVVFLTGLAGCTMLASADHYRGGFRVEAAIDAAFTVLLAFVAALVLARSL